MGLGRVPLMLAMEIDCCAMDLVRLFLGFAFLFPDLLGFPEPDGSATLRDFAARFAGFFFAMPDLLRERESLSGQNLFPGASGKSPAWLARDAGTVRHGGGTA